MAGRDKNRVDMFFLLCKKCIVSIKVISKKGKIILLFPVDSNGW